MKIHEDNFIQELKKGNEKALEYCIDQYGWILKTVLKKHLFYLMEYYDECMNDCLLAIWENIDTFDPNRSEFKNWVGGIAKYKAIDYMRKYLKDQELENIEDYNIAQADPPFQQLLAQEIREETEQLLSPLSKEDQEIFKKLYFEDWKIEEISKDTGLSKSILYNRLSRGRKKIRGALNEGGYKR